MPYQSYERVVPKIKSKKIYKLADKKPQLLETKFPDDPQGRFGLEDLDLTFEEALDGLYLDLTLDSRKKDVSPGSIISKKHGRRTIFLMEEYTEESKKKVKERGSIQSTLDAIDRFKP